MGYLYQRKLKSGERSRIWWAKYYVNGRPVRESTGVASDTEAPPTEAKRFLKLREGAVATGAPLPPRADRILYDELREDLLTFYRTTGRWKKLADVEDRLTHLDGSFNGARAARITPDVLAKYVAKRQSETTHLILERPEEGPPVRRRTSNRTINLELALLRRMFRLAAQRRKVLSVPAFEMLKEAPPRSGFFEEEHYRAVARHLPEDLRVAVAIAHTYGWRIHSEILPLERRQLDLKAGTVRLEPGTTKNDDGRMFVMTPELRACLETQRTRTDELQKKTGQIIPWVFHRKGRRLKGFRKAWLTACKNAGQPGRIPHDFRRTAVRNLERAGVPRSVAMRMVGHKTEAIYRRYAIVDEAQLRDAAAKLARMARAGQSLGQSGDLSEGRVSQKVAKKMVGRDGIEPPTPGFSVLCSTN